MSADLIAFIALPLGILSKFASLLEKGKGAHWNAAFIKKFLPKGGALLLLNTVLTT